MIEVQDILSRTKTKLSEDAIKALIEEAAAEIVMYLGGVPSSPMVEKITAEKLLWLTFRAAEIQSIREVKSGRFIDPDDIEHSGRALIGLYDGYKYEITYEIENYDRLQTIMRGVCIDTVLSRVIDANEKANGTDYVSEKIGDYEYRKNYAGSQKNKDPEIERKAIMRRLKPFRSTIRGAVAR
jgi:hypothetical protein